MFGISFSEILLILVLALLIFGPKQLPKIAAKLGSFIAGCAKFKASLRDQLYTHGGLQQFDSLRQEMQYSLNQIKQQMHFPMQLDQSLDYPTKSLSQNDTAPCQELDYIFLYQPELEFSRQPELFDEFDQHFQIPSSPSI